MGREMYTLKIGTFNQCILISSSDIVVQIVDARNPLLFRCEDLVKQCFLFFSFVLTSAGISSFCSAIIVTEYFQLWSNLEHKL